MAAVLGLSACGPSMEDDCYAFMRATYELANMYDAEYQWPIRQYYFDQYDELCDDIAPR